MSDKLQVTRDAVVAMFQALDFKMAHKWKSDRLLGKIKGLADIVDDSAELPDAEDATLITIQEAMENGVEIEIVDEIVEDAGDDPVDEVECVEEPGDEAADEELVEPEAEAKAEKPAEPVAEKPSKKKKRGRKAKAAKVVEEEKPAEAEVEAPEKPVAEKSSKKAAKAAKDDKARKTSKKKLTEKAVSAIPKSESGPDLGSTPGVRSVRNRRFVAGIVIREKGLEAGITDEMIKLVDEQYGSPNPNVSKKTLVDGWHVINGYVNG